MSALWRDNPATIAQAQFRFPRSTRRARPTQADVLLALLRQARTAGKALTLPEIQETRIAQFTARIYELRRRGFVIENEMERAADGGAHSRYWLRFDPERDGEK